MSAVSTVSTPVCVGVGNLKETYLQGTPESLTQVSDFIKTLATRDLVNLLGLEYPQPLRALLMSRLVSQWQDVTNKDSEAMTYETLLELLSREDYPKGPRGANLEDSLCGMVCYWFKANPSASPDQLMACLAKLRDELLTPDSIAMVTKIPQYQKCQDKLDRRVVELYTNSVTGCEKKQRQRNAKLPTKTLTSEEISALKKGDLIDAQDRGRRWYTAVVEEVNPTQVYVQFQGWDVHNNEWIAKDGKKMATFASITGGRPHNPREKTHTDEELCNCTPTRCDCYGCTHESEPEEDDEDETMPALGSMDRAFANVLMGAMGKLFASAMTQ